MNVSSKPTSRSDGVEAVLARFRQNGGRITSARRAIVSVLLEGDEHQHATAEEVAARIQLAHPEIAVSTVYRSLDALEELGVLEHLHVGHGPTVYHLAHQRHIHLVCRQCGGVADVPGETLDALGADILDLHGFAIEPRHFAINGLCRDCLASGPVRGDVSGSETGEVPRPHTH